MTNVGAFEVEFMGRMLTFDVVTGYGLLCGLVFFTGFVVAMRHEKRLNRLLAEKRSNSGSARNARLDAIRRKHKTGDGRNRPQLVPGVRYVSTRPIRK